MDNRDYLVQTRNKIKPLCATGVSLKISIFTIILVQIYNFHLWDTNATISVIKDAELTGAKRKLTFTEL